MNYKVKYLFLFYKMNFKKKNQNEPNFHGPFKKRKGKI